LGDLWNGVGEHLNHIGDVVDPRQRLRKRKQRASGGVAALGVEEHSEDVQGGGRVLGEEIEDLGL
jgi:hypothetical protein